MNIKKMVDRFMCWKLPKNFGPDAGISFTPFNGMTREEAFERPGWWPTGTNLLSAGQAQQMFEHVIEQTAEMDFGLALDALKAGNKVARQGWNGKGMFVFLVPGSNFKVNRPPLLGIYPEGTEINYRPHIDIKNVDGSVATWVPSITDLMADDWLIVE